MCSAPCGLCRQSRLLYLFMASATILLFFCCLQESGVDVLDKKWVLKYMEYLCAIGLAAFVFEGVLGHEY